MKKYTCCGNTVECHSDVLHTTPICETCGRRMREAQTENWIPGTPEKLEPDRLYAVMKKPASGYAVGVVIRGDDCNWRSSEIIAHYPLPLSMTPATMLRLKRKGEFDV